MSIISRLLFSTFARDCEFIVSCDSCVESVSIWLVLRELQSALIFDQSLKNCEVKSGKGRLYTCKKDSYNAGVPNFVLSKNRWG